MDLARILSDHKCKDLRAARDKGLPVLDEQGRCIGRLVPVGPWILEDAACIGRLTQWRKTFSRMFLTQFEATPSGTRAYLKDVAVGDDSRILFLIEDEEGTVVGHVGLAQVNPESFELDYLIRGRSGGHPRLVYHAEVALLRWGFEVLDIPRCEVGVLSFNWMVVDLHQSVGFEQKARIPLRKIAQDGMVRHELLAGQAQASNVAYSYLRMGLDRQAAHFSHISERPE